MRFLVILLGLLLMLGGGAVAGAQYAPIDLSTIQIVKQVFDQVPGSQEFLKTPMALYAGGGTAGFGLLLIIIAIAAGGKKQPRERAVIKPPSMARETVRPSKPHVPAKRTTAPQPVTPQAAPTPPASVAPPTSPAPKPPPIQSAEPLFKPAPPPEAVPPLIAPQPAAPPPVAAQPKPAAPVQAAPIQAAPVQPPPIKAAPVQAAPPPQAAAPVAPKPAAPQPVAPQPAAPKPAAPKPDAPRPAAPAQPVAAASPAPVATPEPPRAKPQASAQPPASAQAPAPQPQPPQAQAPAAAPTGAPPPDPRMLNRKRVQDLVTINDALKAYQAKNGAFPMVDGIGGANERGAMWIAGLVPDFLKEIPRDPVHGAGTQYVYASNGVDYKLLAFGVSLVGSPNVEVLGIKIDPTRNPTQQNAAFGFWTPGFAGA